MESFHINDYLVIPSKNCIIKNNQQISMTPKMMAVLCVLAKHAKDTVSKELLLDSVWGNVAVSELVLSRAIADLRKAFNETAKQATIILTVSKKGYCLNGKVIPVVASSDKASQSNLLKVSHWIFASSIALLLVYHLNVPQAIIRSPGAAMPRHLTTSPNFENQPRYSRDGQSIIYVEGQESGASTLISYSLVSRRYTEIIGGDYLIRSPVFSPNGQRVAYFQMSQQGCKIVILQIDTRNQESVFSCPYSTSKSLDWSPDSKDLLTTQFDDESSSEGIVFIDTHTQKKTALEYPAQKQSGYLFPRYSTDGNSLAVLYLSPSANLASIQLIDLKTRHGFELTQENSYVNQVVWGGDQTIYYVVASGDRAGIWSVDTHSKQKQLVYSAEIVDLDFSPANSQFVYVEEEREINLWSFSLNQENSPLHQRQTFSSRIDRHPAISHDNQQIAFVSDRTNAFNIWVKNLATGEMEAWTEFTGGVVTDLMWSVDGSLYYSYSNGDKSNVFRMTKPFKRENVFSDQHNYLFRDISVDGETIYYSSDEDSKWKVYRRNLHSRETQLIVDYPVETLRELSSGIYYQNYSDNQIFRALVKDSQVKHQVVLQPSFYIGGWDAANDYLYFFSPAKYPNANIRKYNLLSGEINQVTTIPVSYSKRNHGLSVSEDEQQLFYTRLDHRSRDIILLDFE